MSQRIKTNKIYREEEFYARYANLPLPDRTHITLVKHVWQSPNTVYRKLNELTESRAKINAEIQELLKVGEQILLTNPDK